MPLHSHKFQSYKPDEHLHEMEIKAGKNGQYDEVARDNITRSLAEQPGTLAMYSLKHKENAHQAYMIEI